MSLTTGLLIGLAISAASLVWAVVAWRANAARQAKRKTSEAAERAIFAGRTRDANAVPARQAKIQFGRR